MLIANRHSIKHLNRFFDFVGSSLHGYRFKWILFSVKWNWTRSHESIYSGTRYLEYWRFFSAKIGTNEHATIGILNLEKKTHNRTILNRYWTLTHWNRRWNSTILWFSVYEHSNSIFHLIRWFVLKWKQHKLRQQWLVSLDDKRRCSKSIYKNKILWLIFHCSRSSFLSIWVDHLNCLHFHENRKYYIKSSRIWWAHSFHIFFFFVHWFR